MPAGEEGLGTGPPFYDLGSNDRLDRCDLEVNARSPFEGLTDRSCSLSRRRSADTAVSERELGDFAQRLTKLRRRRRVLHVEQRLTGA